MDKIKGFLKPAVYNILHNKAYGVFYILGTAFTFVFITFMLQLTYSVFTPQAPMNKADRVISIHQFIDKNGKKAGGISLNELNLILENVKEYEAYSLLNGESITIRINNKIKMAQVAFVNAGFWNVNEFDFVQGRAFTAEECADKVNYVIIKENLAETCFGTKNAIGKKIEVQGNEFEIIGIVADFPFISSPSSMVNIWLPYTYNKFIPSYGEFYKIDILFPEHLSMDDAKNRLSNAIIHHFEMKNVQVQLNSGSLMTLQEKKMMNIGSGFFKYGIGIILFLLLLIPAINIITLSVANANGRAEEIALRRAIGATRFSAFRLILIENFILVFTGTILGLLLTKPVIDLIERFVVGEAFYDSMTLITVINPVVIFMGILPLMILFTFLSGGIPAYVVSRLNIVEILKGGKK